MIRPLALGLSSVLLLLAACNAAAGPPTEPAAAASGDVQGVKDGQTTLRAGQTLAIALPSNGSTGYSWSVTGVEGSILTPAQPYGEEITDPHQPGMVGVGGSTHWRLTAARAGTATLTFTYARPWERDAAPAETATYRVVVR